MVRDSPQLRQQTSYTEVMLANALPSRAGERPIDLRDLTPPITTFRGSSSLVGGNPTGFVSSHRAPPVICFYKSSCRGVSVQCFSDVPATTEGSEDDPASQRLYGRLEKRIRILRFHMKVV